MCYLYKANFQEVQYFLDLAKLTILSAIHSIVHVLNFHY